MPPTLESFTISYHKSADLEEYFTYEELVKGMIEIGVSFFNFNNVNFAIEDNRTLFQKIFSNKKALKRVRYLNFFRCRQIEKLTGVLNNLEKLDSLSLIECGITDNNMDDLKKMLDLYLKGRNLKTLTLNHNELNKGRDVISQW